MGTAMAGMLVAESDPKWRLALRELFEQLGYIVREAEDGKRAISSACSLPLDLIILDAALPKLYGLRGIKTIREECPDLPIFVTAEADAIETVLSALRLGACDYALKPLNLDEVQLKVERIMERSRLVNLNKHLLDELAAHDGFGQPIGSGSAIKDAHKLAWEVARTDAAVLIHGERGAGRKFLARAIHDRSNRAGGPFIRFNCAVQSGIQPEVELFGQDGRMSGGTADRIGRLDIAEGGAVFLDEIGMANSAVQEGLLQVLKDKRFTRIGGDESVPADVRLFAATSRDLSRAVESGAFNRELLDALRGAMIYLPPLRERTEDIPAFVEFFIKKYAAETGRHVNSISDSAIQRILACEWEGNIKDLEYCIRRSVIACDGDCIQTAHLAFNGSKPGKRNETGHVRSLREIERDHIKKVLIHCNWNRSKAAGILEIDRKTLRSKIREFGFTPPSDNQNLKK